MDFNDLAIKYLTERERKQIKIYEIPEIDEKLLDIVKIDLILLQKNNILQYSFF